LSQTPILVVGAEAPAWSIAVAAASVGRAVFSATRCGAAGAGGGDGAAMIDAGAGGAGGAWMVVEANASVSRTGDATGVGGTALV
jgi:hypothetical protein